MKVKKEDLLKIIAILNRLVLIEEDVIDITEAFKVKSSIDKTYNIPDNFCVKATNDREKEIVRKWNEDNNKMYHGSKWKSEADKYFLLVKNGKYCRGEINEDLITSEFKKISFEEFEYFVNNPKVKHDKWFVLYGSREEFNELNDSLASSSCGYVNSKECGFDSEGLWVYDVNSDRLKNQGYVQITFKDWEKNYKKRVF